MGNQPAFLYHMYGTYYVNDNIFYGASPRTTAGGYSLGSPIFSNNISYNCYNNDTTFANGTNYVNQNPLFTNVSAVPVTAHSINFALSNSSVGHNGASDATDVGVYGGTAIFNQNGIPAIPYIKTLQITGSNTVPANGTLNISVKSKIVR